MKQAKTARPEPATVRAAANRAHASLGEPLPPAVQRRLAPRFGHHLADVRIHRDAGAADHAAHLNAHAFTVGRHISFGTGQFDPGTRAGYELLVHEVTHASQARAAAGRAPGPPTLAEPEEAAEREAAGTATMRQPGPIRNPGAPGRVYRQETRPETTTEGVVDQHVRMVAEALSQPDPVAGVGDYRAAWRILNGLSMADLLAAFTRLHAQHHLELLAGNTGSMAGVDRPRLLAALYAVQLAIGPVEMPLVARAAAEIEQLPVDQRDEILRFLVSRQGGRSGLTMEGSRRSSKECRRAPRCQRTSGPRPPARSAPARGARPASSRSRSTSETRRMSVSPPTTSSPIQVSGCSPTPSR